MPLLYLMKRTISVRPCNWSYVEHVLKLTILNKDNVCIESLSIDLTRPMLDSAARSVGRLGDKIEE